MEVCPHLVAAWWAEAECTATVGLHTESAKDTTEVEAPAHATGSTGEESVGVREAAAVCAEARRRAAHEEQCGTKTGTMLAVAG